MGRPSFDQTEGYALSVLDTLAAGRRPHPLPNDRSFEPSEELVRIGCERLSLHLHRHLLRSGGRRVRTVLRLGRRQSGRLWDGELNESFKLRFTEASRNLWLGVVQANLQKRPTADLGRTARVEATECGDWLLYDRAAAHLGRLGLEPTRDDALTRRLRSGSPLLVLSALEPHVAQRGALRNQLSRLLQLGTVRIVECLDDVLVPSWLGALATAIERSANLAALTQRFDDAAEVLEAWLDVLEEKERLDLARAVMRSIAALATETGDAEELRDRIARRHPPRNVHERQASERALARVFAVGIRLASLRDRFAALRYGDDRWDEGQLYLAAFDDALAPHLDGIRALERGLRGIIG